MNEPHFELMQTVDERAQVYEELKACNLLRVNMHAWENPQLEDWLELTENGYCDLYRADGWGIYYLTQGLGVTPWAHFAVWPEARQEAKKFLCAAVSHGFNIYKFPAVLGLTPKKFRHVFPLLKACRFEILGTVPGAVSMYGQPADGVISIFRRTSLWAE